eukprot:TRINITY_DN3416_c0_g1_i8.p1 TRINITY_DN3416_c0_g1~~TRINITY_DN3416_c0_g1_i8.p1  ORF type:complete len:1686 (+),score=252.93 TRINITY_DN3416_c0_g1_i8:43-5100(+)
MILGNKMQGIFLALVLSTQPVTSQLTSFDTILTTTCDGTVRMFPDNQLLNVNVDAPFISRMYGKFVDGLRTYVKAKCGSFFNEAVFNKRFDIGSAILTGNEHFQETEFRSDACFDDPSTFTRDGSKMFGVIFGSHEYDMPSTCNWKTWEENGSCAFEYSVRGLQDTTLQVRIEKCSRYGGFPRIFAGCRGRGCSAFTPCLSSSSCGANQMCTDVVDFVGKDTLVSFLTSVGFYKSENSAGDPRNLIEQAIAAFGGLFPGGVRVGSSVCLPRAMGNWNFNRNSLLWWWFGTKRLYTWDKIIRTVSIAWGSGEVPTDDFFGCSDIVTEWVLINSIMNSWDGLVNGASPLEPKSNWVAMPNVVYPESENHIMSVQCDGMIHAFAGTAFPVRIYHPKLIDVLEFWAEQNMAAYPIFDVNSYLNNMALWRIEPYLQTMQGLHSTFGNIHNLWDPDFYFDLTGVGMSILDIRNWNNIKQMDVAIGLRRDRPNPLGIDFSANIRAAQCPGQEKGLTSLHVTCVGEICQQLLLRKTCATGADCGVGLCQALDGYYTNDYTASVLWGCDDLGIPTPWAAHFECPAHEPPGKNYVKLTTEQPVREMLNGVWAGMQYANCDGRAAEKCVSECEMNGASCLPVNGAPPTWNINSGICFPDVTAIDSSNVFSRNDRGAVTFLNILQPPLPLYTSAEVVVDPFPEPTNPVPKPPEAFKGVETLLFGSCEGQFRLFPDNELLSVSIDAEIVPRLFGEYMKAIDRYVTARCVTKAHPKLNDGSGRFIRRFHPLSYFVYSGMADEYDSCLDDSDTFVRDFVKLFKENNMYQESLYLPETCNNVTWFEEGSCKMKVPVRFIPDAALTFNIERCDTNFGYVRFAVGCEGGGCNAMANPCNDDADCGGNSRCVDPIQELGSKKVLNFFRDTLHFVGPKTTQLNAVQDFFNDFVTQFGSYFGGPTPGPGNKKVCFPKEYMSNPRKHNDRDDVMTVKKREKEYMVICGLDGTTWSYPNIWQGNYRLDEIASCSKINPGKLLGARGKTYPTYSLHDHLFVRGIPVQDTFKRPFTVGGGDCYSHDDCSTNGVLSLCLSSFDICTLGERSKECHLLSRSDLKCACSVGIPMRLGYVHHEDLASYGDKCQFTTTGLYNKYISPFEVAKLAVPDIPTFVPWDGLLSDGKTQFQREWSPFPEVRIPSGETHVMSVQCDGLITFFEGTPFAIRVYLPKKQELLQFIADKYISSMSSWIPLGMDPITAFNRDQSPWRPEMYLSRLLKDTGVFPVFASIANEFSFGLNVLGMGDFTFERFMEGKDIGVGLSYNGMREVMGGDFKANIRFQQCSQYPNGLVEMDVTCVGSICQNLQLKEPCATGSRCLLGSCISTHFYDKDILASALWGTDLDALREFGNDWASATTCPTKTLMGYLGVHETNNAKLFQNAASLYSLFIEDDCKGRPQCACLSPGCQWSDVDSSCSATSSIDPAWEQQEINLCLPKLFPFPDAFIKDLGYKTGQIGKPDSANIYSVGRGVSMDRTVTIYGVDTNVEVIGATQMVNITIPDYSCDKSSGGTGSQGSAGGSDGNTDSSGNGGGSTDTGSQGSMGSDGSTDTSQGSIGSDSDTNSSSSYDYDEAASNKTESGLSTGTMIFIVIGAAAGLAVMLIVGLYCAKSGSFKKQATFDPESLEQIYTEEENMQQLVDEDENTNALE